MFLEFLLFTADKYEEDNEETSDNTEDTTGLNEVLIIKYLYKDITSLTCMMVGNITNMFSDPAILSGSRDTDSNQNTGNIISGRFLKRYSIPSTFLRRMLSWSLISTLRGMEDCGSTQKELPWSSGFGSTPNWNCS